MPIEFYLSLSTLYYFGILMNSSQNILLLGAHISTAGGFDQAIARGESIGCTTIQIFTKNNRQWSAPPLSVSAITAFKNAVEHSSIKIVIAHAAYLINLGSSANEIRNKSLHAVIDELERCHQLNIPYLVLHPGAKGDTPELDCLTRIADQLDLALSKANSTTMILLETMAGQGNSICATFEQLAYIYDRVTHKKRIGICFDTCHIFVAGYDLRTESTYHKTWQAFDTILGLNLLKAIHLNDSKKPLGSRVDRHEDIAKGMIGANAFKLLINDARFFNIPKILETPKEGLIDDWRNMRTIEGLISPENKNLLRIDIPQTFGEAKSK